VSPRLIICTNGVSPPVVGAGAARRGGGAEDADPGAARLLPEYQPLHSEFLAQRKILVVDDDPSRLLKKAHLLR